MHQNERFVDSLEQLSNLLLSDETIASTLERVAYLSVRALEPCDSAGVSVIAGDEVITAAGSDRAVEIIDDVQYRTGEGPCLQAIREGRIFKIDSMKDEDRWPDFTGQADKLGVMTSLALPLIVEGVTFGSLNLYSHTDHPFDADDEECGVALAAQASAPVSAMRTYDRLQQVAERLAETAESRVPLATGILMERHACSFDDARLRLEELAAHDRASLEDAAVSIVGPADPAPEADR